MGSGGNSISSILTQPSAKGTIPHTAGFTFTTPNPRIPDQNLPRFNALQAMQQPVLELDETPGLPPSAPAQDGGLAPDSRPAAPATPDQMWSDAETAWAAADEGVSQFLADSMVALFGWAVVVPAVDSSAAASAGGSSTGTAATGTATTGTATTGTATTGTATTGTAATGTATTGTTTTGTTTTGTTTTGSATSGAATTGQAASGVGTLRSVPVHLQAARPGGLLGGFYEAFMGCPYLSVESY